MRKLNPAVLCMLCGLLVGGCVTTGMGPGTFSEGAEQAVSSQAPGNEIQQRAKVHTELGALYLQDGRPAVALEEARIALSVDSSYAPAYNLLGQTRKISGRRSVWRAATLK